MATLKDRYRFDMIAESVKGKKLEPIYRKIAEKNRGGAGVVDSVKVLSFTDTEVKEFKDAQWDHIKEGLVSDGSFQTMEDVRKGLTVKYEHLAKSLGRGPVARDVRGEVIDAFFNEVTGIGTGVDPGVQNNASTPISISPQEATAYYSNGGIAQDVIDKKGKGIFMNGYQFAGQDWDEKELAQLKEHADSINFESATKDWWRDGYGYGGALLVPHLHKDDAMTYQMTEQELAKMGMLGKGCITRFWEADRWNSVLIPNYRIDEADYLTPKEFMIPIAGLTVATWRMGLARPKRLPYWGMIRQMGWGISDFASFMPSLLAYEMGIRSIPIISQQLSLVYLQAPLDAIISSSGMNAAKKVKDDNEKALREWSMLHPRLLNLFGDLKSLERHFTDFDKLILLLKQDVGAKTGFSHTILFNELQTGMDEKSYDITLKQTETIKKSSSEAALQLSPVVRMLVFSAFGYDSPQAKKADKVRIEFDTPVIPTNEENNDTLTAVVNALAGFTHVGFQLQDAVTMVQQFVPRFELTEDIRKRIEAISDIEESVDSAAKKAGLFDSFFGRRL